MDTIQQNIKTIQNAGFNYLKIELEANTGLYDDYNNEHEVIEDDFRGYFDRNDIKLHYLEVYNDGSVDTEATFTIDTKDADKLPNIIKRFTEVIENNGGEIDIDNAGLHISVLMDNIYPCRTFLNEVKLANYRKQVERLMPAILFLSASDSKQSRSFYYRQPRISPDKYSAIHELRGGFEYRLFEPCFGNPYTVLDYINVIAQTVQYYSKRKLKKGLYNLFEMEYTESTNHIYKFFGTPENRTALMACLPYIIKDKKKLIEKTKNLPELKHNLAMRKELKLLTAYYKHLESERIYMRSAVLEDIKHQKRIASDAPCLSFNKRGIKRLYKQRLENLPSFDKYKQGLSSTPTYTFRGSI